MVNVSHPLYAESKVYDEEGELFLVPCSSFREVARAIRLIVDHGGVPYPFVKLHTGDQIDVFERFGAHGLNTKGLRYVGTRPAEIVGVVW